MLRFLQILWIFALHLVLYKLHPRLRDENLGARIRLACERLGVVFKKFGQALAGQCVLDGEDQAELEKLHDQSDPLSFETVRAIVECAFGKPLDTVFGRFNPAPLGSASMAQVHEAEYMGVPVAVKVIRPGVLDSLSADMRIVRALLFLGSLVSRGVRSVRAARIPDELGRMIHDEADLRIEAENTRLIREQYQKELEDGAFTMAKILWESKTVLIQTLIKGVPLSRWMEDHRKLGYHPEEALRRFVSAVFGPPLRGRPHPRLKHILMHADPNFGNLMLVKQPGGRCVIAIIDCGSIGRLRKSDIDVLFSILVAVKENKPSVASDAVLNACRYRFPTERRRAAFEMALCRYVDECHDKVFSYWFIELARILRSHGIPAPQMFTLLARFVLLVDNIAQRYLPGVTTLELIGREVAVGVAMRRTERFASEVAALLEVLTPQTVQEAVVVAVRAVMPGFAQGIERLLETAAPLWRQAA